MKPQSKSALLAVLLALGLGYRFLAAYPLELGRFAPASSALQALHILDGARPIFYSGQAWMGPLGAYLIALMFKLFGANSWTLALFSWLLSALFFGLSVLLAHRLFGLDNALVVAALFLVPVDQVMYLAGQPRAHYTITYVLVPVLLLATLALLRRDRAGRPLPVPATLLGLLSGFAFYTNMAIGPAVGVCVLLLAVHLRQRFFTRVLPGWFGGWLVGFSPVIWYNLTHEAALAGQVTEGAARHFGRVVWAFFTNAWPRFWGVDWRTLENPPLRWIFAALVVWISLLFFAGLLQGWRRWRRGQDALGHQLVFGYLLLHLAVTAISAYGARFIERGNPTGYLVALYAVAFSVPALVLASDLSRRAKTLVLLPLALFTVNNLAANREYPRRFLAAVQADGLSRSKRYPDEHNPFLAYCRSRGLRAGYIGEAFHADDAKRQSFIQSLECFGQVTFSDPSQERYVASALTVDAARRPFWVLANPVSLQTIGVVSRETQVGRWSVHDDFRRELRETSVIDSHAVQTPGDGERAGAAVDRNFDTLWAAGHQPGGQASLVFAFDRPEPLREIVIFPGDVHRSPPAVSVELSDDGQTWRTAFDRELSAPIFWSVFHPFLKQVKPRLQITLPAAQTVQFCRLRFPLQRARAGIAIREALLLRDGPLIEPAAWEREVDAVLAAVRLRGRGAIVAADHWYVDALRLEGFETDFISNAAINDFGQLSPNLEAPVPLDLSRPHLLIVSRGHLPAVEQLLQRREVRYSRTPLRYQVLLRTEPARLEPPLYWNGLELDELGARAPGGRMTLPSPPLREFAPGAVETALKFGDELAVTGVAAALDPEARTLGLTFEVAPRRPMVRDWWLFIHLRDSRGQTVSQGDFRMEQLGRPTSRWAPGNRVLLERTLTAPAQAAGEFSVVIGVWDPGWRRRLRLPSKETEAVVWRGRI